MEWENIKNKECHCPLSVNIGTRNSNRYPLSYPSSFHRTRKNKKYISQLQLVQLYLNQIQSLITTLFFEGESLLLTRIVPRDSEQPIVTFFSIHQTRFGMILASLSPISRARISKHLPKF